MAAGKTIKIEIDADGNIKAEGIGFIGAECDRAMREIDQALGTRTSTKHKAEYNIHATQQTQRNG